MKKITIIGSAGKSPTEYFDRNGKRFVAFNVAVKRVISSRPEWVYINCYDELADFALNHVHQGLKIFVEGTPKISTHTNRHGVTYSNQLIFADYLSLYTDD